DLAVRQWQPSRSASRSHWDKVSGWGLRVQAWNHSGRSEVVLGVGRALLASPPPSAYASEAAPQLLLRRAEGYFSADMRSEITRGASWQLEVRVPPSDGSQAVTLHFPDTHRLPRSAQLMLVDEQSGARIPLRSRANYTFTAPPAGGTYTFRVEPMSARALLRVLTPTVHGGRSRGEAFQIGFTLTAPAQVQVNVRSGARKVRTLTLNASRSEGYQQVVWDGRDDAGVALPPGQYIVEVVAQSEDGQVARAVVPLLSTR
ncbi:MAG: FlgD immunoglobulin-like domain containing protein, partial [Fimbriimonadales bacterium]